LIEGNQGMQVYTETLITSMPLNSSLPTRLHYYDVIAEAGYGTHKHVTSCSPLLRQRGHAPFALKVVRQWKTGLDLCGGEASNQSPAAQQLIMRAALGTVLTYWFSIADGPCTLASAITAVNAMCAVKIANAAVDTHAHLHVPGARASAGSAA
jgi:hypothetical protein